MPFQDFIRKYKKIGQVLAGNDGDWRVEKVKDIDDTIKVAKYATVTHFMLRQARIDFVLRRWIAMRKLGILTDCELYADMTHVALVQKLWPRDCDFETNEVNPFTNIEENVALLMKTICPKLKIIHDTGFVHCDIKPRNILMDFDGQSKRPVAFQLIDFESIHDLNTGKKVIIGTALYEAPEVHDTEFRLTTKYDIFSLGVSLIKMITMKHPIGQRDGFPRNYDQGPIQSKEIIDILDKCKLLNEDKHREFKELLKNMTNTILEERYDIDQVINHNWYKTHCN